VLESYGADLDALAVPELERIGAACAARAADCGCITANGLLGKTLAAAKAKGGATSVPSSSASAP
jgi:hypothetical protein